MQTDKNIIIIAGPSGSGKGTIIKELPDNYKKAVSVTTRKPRAGEIEGVSYYFITETQLFEMRDRGELLEYNQYDSGWYATQKNQIDKIFNEGKSVVFDIDIHGAFNIKKIYPEAILIFILPPNVFVQEKRLRERGTNSEESIRSRMLETKNEIANADKFDCVIINGENAVEYTVKQIIDFIETRQYNKEQIKHYIDNYFERSLI